MVDLSVAERPAFLGGGVLNSVESARTVAFLASGGGEGVAAPLDLKVRALATPGPRVTVDPGVYVALQRFSNSRVESYVGAVRERVTVDVDPSPASGAQSWLVVVSVDDPFVSGSPFSGPADVTEFNPAKVQVVGPVASSVTDVHQLPLWANRSAVTLARVTLPASQGTVTSAMITDLRELANPRSRSRGFFAVGQGSTNYPLTQTSMAQWPGTPEFDIAVPAWATHAVVRAVIWNSSFFAAPGGGTNNGAQGDIRVQFAGQFTAAGAYDVNWLGSPHRVIVGVLGELSMPTNVRGTIQKALFQGRRNAGNNYLAFNAGANVEIQITFEERVA